ncbi:MAG: AAA family ATPase [Muribaculaceae bacterium]|jgi:Predicted AAA-ATPase.
METIKYPVGIQTFERLRQDGYKYIDKTDLVCKLVNNATSVFLSRPRRFGKSLLLSTIDAYFRGRRDLFKGLAIDSLTEEWEQHPVFHLDLSGCSYLDKDSLELHIDMYLTRWEKIYGDENKNRDISSRFASLLVLAYEKTGKKAVVLIDEYDKPLLDTIEEERGEIHGYFKDVLRGFYGCLKSSDPYLRFVMLTGVTKFSQVSIFSGLNNLNDISLDKRFSTICGITPEELETELSEGVDKLATENGMSREETLAELKERYDGYHFASDLRDVYNPFSIVRVLDNCQFGNYWLQSGNPRFLAIKLREKGIDLMSLQRSMETSAQLQDVDLAMTNPLPLLFQMGYLTIKGYDRTFDEYSLGYPNREVKESFLRLISMIQNDQPEDMT